MSSSKRKSERQVRKHGVYHDPLATVPENPYRVQGLARAWERVWARFLKGFGQKDVFAMGVDFKNRQDALTELHDSDIAEFMMFLQSNGELVMPMPEVDE